MLLDGLSVDDQLAPDVASILSAGCATHPDSQVDDQAASTAENPSTGQPVAGSGDLLVSVGGPYGQHVVAYAESAGIAAVYDVGVSGDAVFEGRPNDGGVRQILVDAPLATLTDTHDYFVIASLVDPESGTRILEIYGFFSPGTIAAEWFLENRVLPSLGTFTHAYYIYEWTHGDAGTLPGSSDTFRLVTSGD